MNDERYKIIRARLSTLSDNRLELILHAVRHDMIVYDDVNFDGERFCPLAVGLLCPFMAAPTQDSVVAEIAKHFDPPNALKGVPGDFYHGDTESRRVDLLRVIGDIQNERARRNARFSAFSAE